MCTLLTHTFVEIRKSTHKIRKILIFLKFRALENNSGFRLNVIFPGQPGNFREHCCPETIYAHHGLSDCSMKPSLSHFSTSFSGISVLNKGTRLRRYFMVFHLSGWLLWVRATSPSLANSPFFFFFFFFLSKTSVFFWWNWQICQLKIGWYVFLNINLIYSESKL